MIILAVLYCLDLVETALPFLVFPRFMGGGWPHVYHEPLFSNLRPPTLSS